MNMKDWFLVQHTNYLNGSRWHFLNKEDLEDYKNNCLEDGAYIMPISEGINKISKEDTIDYEGATIQPPINLIEYVKSFVR